MPDYQKGGNAGQQGGTLAWRDIWHAAVPAVLYTLISNVVYFLAGAGSLKLSGVMRQGAAVIVCLFVFSGRADAEQLKIRSRRRTLLRFPADFCFVAAAVMCGAACNYIISLSGLSDASSGYRRVSGIFYGNGLLLEIAVLCVLGPLAEELVYRGFVYQRLRRSGSSTAAVCISALLFGVMHFNLVQGIYGFVLGLLLAYAVLRTDSFLTAAAAHMASNFVSVLWTETHWLDFLNREGMGKWEMAVLCLGLTAVFLIYGSRLSRAAAAAGMRHGHEGRGL